MRVEPGEFEGEGAGVLGMKLAQVEDFGCQRLSLHFSVYNISYCNCLVFSQNFCIFFFYIKGS